MIKVYQFALEEKYLLNTDAQGAFTSLMLGNIAAASKVWNGEHEYLSYKLVAKVDTTNLEKAYERTNTIDDLWFESEKNIVVESSAKAGCRSTSIGDLMQDEDGQLHIVSLLGFKPFEPEKPSPASPKIR